MNIELVCENNLIEKCYFYSMEDAGRLWRVDMVKKYIDTQSKSCGKYICNPVHYNIFYKQRIIAL